MQHMVLAARTLRELARRLEAGEYDRVEITQMCPMQNRDGVWPLPVLIVHMVAWRSTMQGVGTSDSKEEDRGTTSVSL